MNKIAKNLTGFFIDTVLPVRCVGCRKVNQNSFCEPCKQALKPAENLTCIICQKQNILGFTHAKCETKVSPEFVYSAFTYKEGLLDKAIISGKYMGVKSIFPIFGDLLACQALEKFDYSFLKQFWVCPLPLHATRQNWRGFNQTELLAKEFALKTNLAYLPVLARFKKTKTQKDLHKNERLQNVENCFKIFNAEDVSGRNFLILDDVITTGATLLTAVKTLKYAGANQVACITLARE